jgi:hypothetical protein
MNFRRIFNKDLTIVISIFRLQLFIFALIFNQMFIKVIAYGYCY